VLGDWLMVQPAPLPPKPVMPVLTKGDGGKVNGGRSGKGGVVGGLVRATPGCGWLVMIKASRRGAVVQLPEAPSAGKVTVEMAPL